MNERLVFRIIEAYKETEGLEPEATRRIYSAWIASALRDLGNLNDSLKQRVMERLTTEKIDAIKSASAQGRVGIWRGDALLATLSPIDYQSQEWAEKVAAGEQLNGDETTTARSYLQQLEVIYENNKLLPHEISQAIFERISETTLDLIYALEQGNAPKSLRRGRSEGRRRPT